MDIKKRLITILILIAFQAAGQGVETQKKYSFSEKQNIKAFVASTASLSNFKSHYHALNIYYDLYLETDKNDLYNMGFSLRFRKRIMHDSIVSYTFQLKDEMNVDKEVRMEIEEKELDFYNVKDGLKWTPLTTVLDTIFNYYNKSTKEKDSVIFYHNLLLINSWINIKANGAIAPFQRLRHLDSLTFNVQKIQSLKPVIIGRSFRKRGHIFINQQYTQHKKLSFNRKNINETPLFFQQNPTYNWLFESSLDDATFSTLNGQKTINIKEYEVENKFNNEVKGRILLNEYEDVLINSLGLSVKYDSKFKQSMQSLQLSDSP